jgi:hypothetical protein
MTKKQRLPLQDKLKRHPQWIRWGKDFVHRMIYACGLLCLVDSSLKLRSDVKLTLQCYTHSVSEDRMGAGAMLAAIFRHAADRSGLKAD